ncbi:MAG: lipoate--protein ligase family protein [Pirellulales bacterium]|nr:lipoate--protein ligase family protein [Pirellulales bacterium]
MNLATAHRCRLLVDPPGGAAWNMAVDELLAIGVAEPNELGCALRFYQWEKPTLSLGYFQSLPPDYRDMVERGELALVRRASGGGAILHDRELTYSFVVGIEHPLAADAETLYRHCHAALVTVLARSKVSAELAEHREARPPAEQPFLCFERRAPGDVVVGPSKIAGSAQRRQRQAILQHGSILLATSLHAPQIPGLREISQFQGSPDSLAHELQKELATQLRLAFEMRPLSSTERATAGALVETRYGNRDWTLAR